MVKRLSDICFSIGILTIIAPSSAGLLPRQSSSLPRAPSSSSSAGDGLDGEEILVYKFRSMSSHRRTAAW